MSTVEESHVDSGVIGSISHSNPYSYPPLRPNVYGTMYGGVSTSYPSPPIRCPLVPYTYSNPPPNPSYSTSQVGTDTFYSSPLTHQHVHGQACISSSCIGSTLNPYYPFPIPPPTTQVPLFMIPQPPINIGQHTPPLQGQVYSQQNVANPPNRNPNINKKKKNKGKGKENTNTQIKEIKVTKINNPIILEATIMLQIKVKITIPNQNREINLSFELIILSLFVVYINIILINVHFYLSCFD
jgi:hypothetical protein